MIPENITGVVLAGGKSSRMGRDKALLAWQGKPLILHAVGILQQVCSKVIISANKYEYAFTGCEIWPDELTIPAPITGIYSCLKRSAGEWIMVLSCDMPHVTPALLTYLQKFDHAYDVIVPVHDNNCIEPLCGLYHRRILPLLEVALEGHQYSLQQFIAGTTHKLVKILPDNPVFSPTLFLNINTPGDYPDGVPPPRRGG
jgi:molybdopterin-guanine dinucleotide biosynthesis protein A